MTFKDILRHSRTMSYKQLDRYYIRCIRNGYFIASDAINSMRWLSTIKKDTHPKARIRKWKYAVKAYKRYKANLKGGLK